MSATKKATMEVVREKIKYNPKSDYQWKEDDKVYITGKEFEIFHSTLATLFTKGIPEPQMYIMLHGMFQISSNVLVRNVEQGIFKEVV